MLRAIMYVLMIGKFFELLGLESSGTSVGLQRSREIKTILEL